MNKIGPFISRLKQIPFFKEFTKEELKTLTPHLTEERLGPEKTIFKEGDLGKDLCWVEKGQVLIFKDWDGLGSLNLAMLSDGEFFGEMTTLGQARRFASAKTTQDTLLIVFKNFSFSHLEKLKPVLAASFLQKMIAGSSLRLKLMTESFCHLLSLSVALAESKEKQTLRQKFAKTLELVLSKDCCEGAVWLEFNPTLSAYIPQSHWGNVPAEFLVAQSELARDASCLVLPFDRQTNYLLVLEARGQSLNQKIPFIESLGRLFNTAYPQRPGEATAPTPLELAKK